VGMTGDAALDLAYRGAADMIAAAMEDLSC
jgi:hypothetical protein